MKTFKLITVVICLLLAAPDTQAQFLKKLKKKVEKTLEQTAIEKIDDKVEDAASKSMDKMLNGDFMKGNPMINTGEMADMSEVPDTYDFEYLYVLQMADDTKGEKVDMNMHLKPDASYWGMSMPQAGDITMVHDVDNELMVMFMADKGQKMAMAMKIDPSDMINYEEEEQPEFDVREIEGKEILGYDCQGFEVETDEYLVTVYNTFEAEVSLVNVFGANKELPDNFDPKWLQQDGNYGLMMEMHMKDKTGKEDDVSMKCVKLEKQPITIAKADYESMGMASMKQ
ncbi:hypothetical protein [Robertkochia aurantiaca]|uniref:hypothetical protein n=1 Tax=Robertkochia aurantiaca TaxID=2873700 RepID=UPI001CCFDB46|nr:hypothetical protein [Robertkochia sp. 3YJGBD-33]